MYALPLSVHSSLSANMPALSAGRWAGSARRNATGVSGALACRTDVDDAHGQRGGSAVQEISEGNEGEGGGGDEGEGRLGLAVVPAVPVHRRPVDGWVGGQEGQKWRWRDGLLTIALLVYWRD